MNNKTRMAFLVDEDFGEVTAFFVDDKWNEKDYTSYSHVGQHGPASVEWAKGCRQARKDEYTALLNELTEIGYDVEAVKLADFF